MLISKKLDGNLMLGDGRETKNIITLWQESGSDGATSRDTGKVRHSMLNLITYLFVCLFLLLFVI